MQEEQFYNELYDILDSNKISYEDNKANRDTAIKILIELKKRKAQKFKKVLIEEQDIIAVYINFGMSGIKKMFNRNDCYLYDSEFVFSILFYHYKESWIELEDLIRWKLINDYE
tara:strand:- start:1191 stop:1532 length:342 start_codon:yes stop_codon:yes gene_type:complete